MAWSVAQFRQTVKAASGAVCLGMARLQAPCYRRAIPPDKQGTLTVTHTYSNSWPAWQDAGDSKPPDDLLSSRPGVRVPPGAPPAGKWFHRGACATRHAGVLAAAAFPATGMALAAGPIALSKTGEHDRHSAVNAAL